MLRPCLEQGKRSARFSKFCFYRYVGKKQCAIIFLCKYNYFYTNDTVVITKTSSIGDLRNVYYTGIMNSGLADLVQICFHVLKLQAEGMPPPVEAESPGMFLACNYCTPPIYIPFVLLRRLTAADSELY
jgi:hypothetical protein